MNEPSDSDLLATVAPLHSSDDTETPKGVFVAKGECG